MTSGKPLTRRDFCLAAGYGGAEREDASKPLIRGQDDPVRIMLAEVGLPGFTARSVVDAPPKAKAEQGWPPRAAAPTKVEKVSAPRQRSRFGQVVAWGNDGGALS